LLTKLTGIEIRNAAASSAPRQVASVSIVAGVSARISRWRRSSRSVSRKISAAMAWTSA
jgi:hypothetical protein